MDNMQKIDYLTKRSSELLADMRRLEKENQKNKRSRDNLQKERDSNRTELSKTVGLKEKLEKLCRELQRDNNKMKVSTGDPCSQAGGETREAVHSDTDVGDIRTRTKSSRSPIGVIRLHGTKNMRRYSIKWRGIRKKKIRRRSRWSIWTWKNCKHA